MTSTRVGWPGSTRTWVFEGELRNLHNSSAGSFMHGLKTRVTGRRHWFAPRAGLISIQLHCV